MRRTLAAFCFAVALPAVAQVVVAPPAKPKQQIVAAPAEAPGAIKRLRIILNTGEDDLRRNSELVAFLILKDGRRITSEPLNCRKRNDSLVCEGFPGKSRKTLEWRVIEPVRPDQVHRFGLGFKSGKAGPFDTADNWDLQGLEVEYVVPAADPSHGIAAGTFPLIKLTGRPIYRFKTAEEWESDPVVLRGAR